MAPAVGGVQNRGVRLSLQAQYAICGMFDLAYNGAGEPIQVRVIGERQRIPARYLEQIFQRLRRARLVTGKRGPGGGYVLARSPAEINLRDVVEPVEGPLDGDLAGGPPPRDDAVPFRPHFLWKEVAASLAATLERIDLEALCRRAARSAVPRAHPDSHMYFI
jgi:Rrf2 family protein